MPTLILMILALPLVILNACKEGNSPRAEVSTESLLSYNVQAYDFEVGNSLYPLNRGAFKGFQRYLNSDQQVRGYLEWEESYAIRYQWSFTVYAPDDSTVLDWSGTNLKHSFSFTAGTDGVYKIEILKRDPQARAARLAIDPPNWDKWGIQ